MHPLVIVVGAGISGLYAANLLKESGINVLVLEARNRVGGRTLTIRNSNVEYVDLGGSYVLPAQKDLLNLSQKLGIENYKVDQDGDILIYKNGQRMYSKISKSTFQWNPFVGLDIYNVSRKINKMMEEVPLEAPWDAPQAEKWDAVTFQEFLTTNCWTQYAVDYFNDIIGVHITSQCFEVSLLSCLKYLKLCGGINVDKPELIKFDEGSQLICEKIAKDLGDVLITNSQVVGINQSSKDFIHVKTLDGKEYVAKFVILACPPMIQLKIHFMPPLPPLRNQLTQMMPTETTCKVLLYYETEFWKEKGFSGSSIISGGDEYPMFCTLSDTKPDGGYPAIVGFISSTNCIKLLHLKPEERKNLFAKSFAEVTGYEEALKIREDLLYTPVQVAGGKYYYSSTYQEIPSIHRFVYIQDFEERRRGVAGEAFYLFYQLPLPLGSGKRIFSRSSFKILSDPIDRIHFAGTETAVKWNGSMAGALEAGERAAKEILYKLK